VVGSCVVAVTRSSVAVAVTRSSVVVVVVVK